MSDGYSDYVRSVAEDLEMQRKYGGLLKFVTSPEGKPVPRVTVIEPGESVKEIYWRLKAERLERELAARTSAPAYFWLGREAEAA